jgi:hypothetical protein
VPDPKPIEVVDEAVATILRTKTLAERLAMEFEVHETAWQITTAEFQRNTRIVEMIRFAPRSLGH